MASLTCGHEFEQAPGVGNIQENLACCSRWGCKELDTTEQMNLTELNVKLGYLHYDGKLHNLNTYTINYFLKSKH